MIDNFAPQPYPLEATADGNTWQLVIGWRQAPGSTNLTPVLAHADGPLTTAGSPTSLRYRLPDARRPAVAASARSSAAEERVARATPARRARGT